MSEHAVLIVGAGPTGMMLAAELALAGVDVAIVERRARAEILDSRAGGLHARTIELFDMRGIAERFLSQGQVAQVVAFNLVRLDISDFPTRHPYGLALWQRKIELILAEWIGELGVRIHRGREVVGLSEDASGVTVALSDGESLRASHLVGCDGARSVVRKAAGIEFPGFDPTTSWLIAEVEMREAPALGFKQDAAGVHAMNRLENGHTVRLVLTERTLQRGSEPSLDELREALIAVYGTDFGVHDPTWLSRFTDATRHVARYRQGRVLLAGDAAHIHPPIGGQGLNLGVQDAVNLGWKLAQVVRGISPESLLDTYEAERRPVISGILRNIMAQGALRRTDERTKALSEVLAPLVVLAEPRRRLAGEMSGLGISYDLGPGHPLLGRRMPDLDLVTAEGEKRLFSFLHAARPLLVNFGEPGAIDVGPWAERVRLVEARHEGPWELPVVGRVEPVPAALVRPDGHVAWTGDGTQTGLREALAKWCGSAAV